MGLLDRLSRLFRANVNDLITRSEDPEVMLTQIVMDMRTQLAKAKQQVASAIAEEKRLHDHAEAEYRQATEWERKAMLAINEGRDDLAREALGKQQQAMVHGQQLEQNWQAHRHEIERLKAALRDLNDKIEEAKRKKHLLVARERRNKAHKRINETMSSLSEESAFEAFSRMEDRVETNERQLKAHAEVEADLGGAALLAGEFKAIEQRGAHAAVEARLIELKQRMAALPAGVPVEARRLVAGDEEKSGEK